MIDTLNVAGGLAAIVWHAIDQLDNNLDIKPTELIKEIEAGGMISSHSGPGGFGISGLEE